MDFYPQWEASAAFRIDPTQLRPYMRWLAQQPAAQGYDSDDHRSPAAQYFRSLGYRDVEVMPGLVRFQGGEKALPYWFDVIARNGERTYGAALARARALARAAGVSAD